MTHTCVARKAQLASKKLVKICYARSPTFDVKCIFYEPYHPDLLFPNLLQRLYGHERQIHVLELHEVDDQADGDPHQEQAEDVEAGNDQVEAEEACDHHRKPFSAVTSQ